MKQNYSLLLSGMMAVATFTSCNRAAYSLPTATAVHQGQAVASAPATAATMAEAPTLTAAALLSPEATTVPARRAAATLAAAPAAAGTKAAAVAPVQRPAEQAADRQPQAPTKPAKIAKGVWIGIGVGVLLAILRIVAAS